MVRARAWRRLLLLSRRPKNHYYLPSFPTFRDEVEGAAPIVVLVAVEVVERAAVRELPAPEHEALLVRLRDTRLVLNVAQSDS